MANNKHLNLSECVSCGYKKDKFYTCATCGCKVCHQCIINGQCKDCFNMVESKTYTNEYKFGEN